MLGTYFPTLPNLTCDLSVTYSLGMDEVFKALADQSRRLLLGTVSPYGEKYAPQVIVSKRGITRFAQLAACLNNRLRNGDQVKAFWPGSHGPKDLLA